MPYPKDVPICKHYLYDYKGGEGWYCELKPYVHSRLECKHCPYCQPEERNDQYDRSRI